MPVWITELIAFFTSGGLTSLFSSLGTVIASIVATLTSSGVQTEITNLIDGFERITSEVTTDAEAALAWAESEYQVLLSDFGAATSAKSARAKAAAAVSMVGVTQAQMAAIVAVHLAKIEAEMPGHTQSLQAKHIGMGDMTIPFKLASRLIETGYANSLVKSGKVTMPKKP